MNKIGKFFFGAMLLIISSVVYPIDSDTWILTPGSLGPIKVNMTIKEVEKATHLQFSTEKPESEIEDGSCFSTTLQGLDNVSFMISHDKIARININGGKFKTDKGAQIGTSEVQLQTRYDNKLISEPHKYEENGHYLTLLVPGDGLAIRFETNGEKITRMYSGNNEEVHFVEDCL